MRPWLLLLIPSLALASSPPAAVTATALQALQQSSDMSGCVEHAGVLIQNTSTGAIRSTVPVTGEKDNFELRIAVYAGEKIVAIYHTHPLCDDRKSDEMFSPNDVATADQLNVPSYIWVGYDDSLRVYVPHQSALARVINKGDYGGDVVYGSYGAILGHTECDEVPVKLSVAGTVEYRHTCRYW